MGEFSSPPAVGWGCCLPWVLSLPAGREFFGVGWCLFHLPHSLWELAWLISALVSPLSLAAHAATARACARLHVLPHALYCSGAAALPARAAQPHPRAPAAQPLSYLGGAAAPLYSGGAAALMCERRSRSALLCCRMRLSSTSMKWGKLPRDTGHVKAGGERRRLCLRKSALAGSWSCVSGYLPGACALSLLSGRAGLWAARALAALMGFRESSLAG